jgi:hypothetical protein
VTGNYTLLSIDTGVNANGTLTITLPASPSTGQTITINNTGSGTVTVSGSITGGYSGATLPSGASITLAWNGVTWVVSSSTGSISYIIASYFVPAQPGGYDGHYTITYTDGHPLTTIVITSATNPWTVTTSHNEATLVALLSAVIADIVAGTTYITGTYSGSVWDAGVGGYAAVSGNYASNPVYFDGVSGEQFGATELYLDNTSPVALITTSSSRPDLLGIGVQIGNFMAQGINNSVTITGYTHP